MSNVRVFKKGEFLFKEGDKTGSLFLIQSGLVSLRLHRQKAPIEIFNLSTNQILGESVLSGVPTHTHSAVALSETKVIELPADAVKVQVEQTPQLIKLLVKSMSDKLKTTMTEVRSSRLDKDQTPCPPDQTAKIFAAIFHTAKSKAESSKTAEFAGWQVVNWQTMRQYAQRMFGESPKRLETATNIFVKLGSAKYQMGRPPDDPEANEEIQQVYFQDLALVEQFFEFYQYYHFKGGKQELLRTDERMMQLVGFLIEHSANEPRDRHGAVRLDFAKTVEAFKQKVGWNLNADHFGNLENKGLFVKRQSTETGVALSFEFQEFERTHRVWKVLREVERWNEKGSVDPYEPLVEPRKVAMGAGFCPSCQASFVGNPKFCADCGNKVAA